MRRGLLKPAAIDREDEPDVSAFRILRPNMPVKDGVEPRALGLNARDRLNALNGCCDAHARFTSASAAASEPSLSSHSWSASMLKPI